MNRDTAVAIWYRRIDPRCFTTQGSPAMDEDTGRPATPSHVGRPERRPALQPATVVPNSWLPIPDERKRWILGSLAERLNRGRMAG